MADDNNLYPADAPQTRRRGRRKPRPKHLPPYQPRGDAPDPENEAKAKKQLAATPAAAAFGAKKGAGNALLFHALKSTPKPPSAAQRDDGEADESDEDA